MSSRGSKLWRPDPRPGLWRRPGQASLNFSGSPSCLETRLWTILFVTSFITRDQEPEMMTGSEGLLPVRLGSRRLPPQRRAAHSRRSFEVQLGPEPLHRGPCSKVRSASRCLAATVPDGPSLRVLNFNKGKLSFVVCQGPWSVPLSPGSRPLGRMLPRREARL